MKTQFYTPKKRSSVMFLIASLLFVTSLACSLGVGGPTSTLTSVIPEPTLASTPQPGTWKATAEFGEFTFVVNSKGTGVNAYNFGGIRITTNDDSGYPIKDSKFGSMLDFIRIEGEFDSSTTASGTWEYLKKSGSGTWTAIRDGASTAETHISSPTSTPRAIPSGTGLPVTLPTSEPSQTPVQMPTAVPTSAPRAGWLRRANMPTARQNPGVAALNGKVHVVGGWTDTAVATHEVYDPQSDSWQSLPALPIPRSDLMLAAVGGKLYAIGGYNPSLDGAVALNHVYDPVANTWSTATSAITPASGAGVAVVNDTIYIIGGWDNTVESAVVQSYNTVSDSWTVRASMPTARSELGAAALNGLVYAVGGSISGTLAANVVEVYNPATNSWSSAAPLPKSRTALAVTAGEGKLYAIGGGNVWSGGSPQSTTFVYEPATNSWSTIAPMLTARWCCGAATINGLVYVIGGIDGTGNNSAANEAFALVPLTTTPIAFAPTFSPVRATSTLDSTPEPSATSRLVRSSISQQNPKRYRVEFSATIKNEGFTLNKLLVYQPRPIAWDGQQDINVETVSPVPAKQGEDPVFGNGLYYWNIEQEMPRIGESLQFRIIFTYTAYEIIAKINPNDLQPYDTHSPLYKLYTRPERFIESTDPQIVEIADQVASGEENPFLLAQKYYNYVVETAHYRLVGKGLLGAKALLTNGEGECGDYAALFIALSRAKGIPARSVVGYWAITGIEQTHVWAEFYLEGIGWIPVDPTVGQQSSSNKNYYFGRMDNQRVILQKGFNFPMDPPAPDNYLAPLMQGPAWWFWGDGDGDKMSLEVTGWNVQ